MEKKKEIKGIKEVKRGNQCTKDTSEMSTKDKRFSVMFVPLLICSKPSVLSGSGHLRVCEPLLFKGNATQQNTRLCFLIPYLHEQIKLYSILAYCLFFALYRIMSNTY